MPRPVGKSAIWIADYLGQFPHGAVVPRESLRAMAHERRRAPARDQVQLSSGRMARRKMQGRLSGWSDGRKSTEQLTVSLKELERLGLVSRDTEADAVIVTSPSGLRKLVELREMEKRVNSAAF